MGPTAITLVMRWPGESSFLYQWSRTTSSLQMSQEGAVYAAPKMLFELKDSHAAIGAFVDKRQEAATFPFLHRHLGHHGDSCTGRHHGQDRRELAAFKDHIGLQPGASAGRQGVFAEAVAFLEQEKGIVFDLRKMDVGRRPQPMTRGDDHV